MCVHARACMYMSVKTDLERFPQIYIYINCVFGYQPFFNICFLNKTNKVLLLGFYYLFCMGTSVFFSVLWVEIVDIFADSDR